MLHDEPWLKASLLLVLFRYNTIIYFYVPFYFILFILQATAVKPDKPEVASVISKYVAEGASEISLNVGQLVHVMLKNPDGWWQGELQVMWNIKIDPTFNNNFKTLLSVKKTAFQEYEVLKLLFLPYSLI